MIFIMANIWGAGLEGGYWPVTATSDGISVTAITPGDYTDLTFAVHEGSAPTGPEVAWNASTKTGTFAMPGSDVVLTPIYAKAAAFATTGTEPEVKTLLPEAAEGVIAGTDASLIAEGTGIVAFAGTSTEVTQGTLMYAIGTSATEAPALTAFSATVPTAKDIADDGATLYVWYYIQGADAPDGVAATLDNTFDNTEPACLTVQVLTNKFDIQFNAANANTIEAGKATVTVGGTDKTVTEGKLQGVKMGSEVKVKANTGYKFRKVEVKKKAKAPTLAETLTTAGMTVSVSFLLHDNAETVNFTSNGDGTYTKTGGTGTTATAPDWTIQLVENNGLIVFKAHESDKGENSDEAFKFNFFPSDNTYYMWRGLQAQYDFEVTFTSISVNGTAIAVTEAQSN